LVKGYVAATETRLLSEGRKYQISCFFLGAGDISMIAIPFVVENTDFSLTILC
jgi:hypothetical protein